jgi:hypothetical protein
MENANDHKLHEQFAAAKACLKRMCPPDEITRRTGVASSTVRALADYRAYLSDLEREAKSVSGCGGLRGQLADRAFAAEGQVRVLLAEGLSSLNDLRDSGVLHTSLALFAEALDDHAIDFRTAAKESVTQAQRYLQLPEAFANEALKVIERRAVPPRYEKESDTLVFKGGVGNELTENRIRLAPRAGDMGRIGLEHFFGGAGRISIQPAPPGAQPGDCHHGAGQIGPLRSVDAYAGMVATLASTREAMYRHARKVSQYGHGTMLQAEEPVTALLVVAGIGLTIFTVTVVASAVSLVTGGGLGPTFTVGGMSFPIALAFGGAAGVAGVLAGVIVLFLLFV